MLTIISYDHSDIPVDDIDIDMGTLALPNLGRSL